MKRICVIDGQGGGIGSTLIKKIKEIYGESVEVIALGTNAIATAQMLRAGANRGATGENAIVHTTKTMDVVLGPLGIVVPHAMMGEVSPRIATAVAGCSAAKFLLPLYQENLSVVGIAALPLPHLIDELIEKHLHDFIRTDGDCP